jgi:hypothetical protein
MGSTNFKMGRGAGVPIANDTQLDNIVIHVSTDSSGKAA